MSSSLYFVQVTLAIELDDFLVNTFDDVQDWVDGALMGTDIIQEYRIESIHRVSHLSLFVDEDGEEIEYDA